jgi:hypothetical protein
MTTLWIRGPQPSRVDAEWLTYLWQKGRRELRRGTQKYEEPFEAFGDGLRRLGLEGAQPGRADWAIVLQDPPAKFLGALVMGALKLHWKSADAQPRARAAFNDREIYAELYR